VTTRRVELYAGKQGFDFLGCHLSPNTQNRPVGNT
jgi:hypothetical protein